MSLDPDDRLEALRREVLAEAPPAAPPEPQAPASVPAPPNVPAPPDVPVLPVAPPPPSPPTPRPAPVLVKDVPPVTPPVDPPSDDRLGLGDLGLGDLDLRALLANRSLSDWLGIGLIVVGAYLVLSWLVPGVSILGSLALLAAGIGLLYWHFARRAAPWTLYAGAVLTGMGAARVLGDLLPGTWHGATSIGIGVAFPVYFTGPVQTS